MPTRDSAALPVVPSRCKFAPAREAIRSTLPPARAASAAAVRAIPDKAVEDAVAARRMSDSMRRAVAVVVLAADRIALT